MDEKQTKRNEAFRRLAKNRINGVLNGYRLLANLNSANYYSTQNERNQILSKLRNGLEALEYAWSGVKPDKEQFQFNDEISDEEFEEGPLIDVSGEDSNE